MLSAKVGTMCCLRMYNTPSSCPEGWGVRRSGGWLGGHGRGLGGEARGRTGRGRRAGRGAPEPSLSRFSLVRECVRSGREPHGRVRTWEQFGKFHPNASLAHSAAFLLRRPSAETRPCQEGSKDSLCGVAPTATGSWAAWDLKHRGN